jgi:hypothetical protein
MKEGGDQKAIQEKLESNANKIRDERYDFLRRHLEAPLGSKEHNALQDAMAKTIGELFGDKGKDELAKATAAYSSFVPAERAPPISLQALTSTADYNGFNTMSLKPDKTPFNVMWTSIGAENQMIQKFKEETGKRGDQAAYRKWREEKLENWTKRAGFEVKEKK